MLNYINDGEHTWAHPPRDENVSVNDVDDDYIMIRKIVDADYMYLNTPNPWW